MADSKKFVIYRTADKLVAGIVYPRRTEEQTNRALAAELENVINSELGGNADDYAHATFTDEAIPEGKKVAIDPDGLVIFDDNPEYVRHAQARESANAKLASLGFSPDEIGVIGR